MKAVARILWTFGTALPIQRWLGAIALAGAALGALAMVLSWPGVSALSLVSIAMYVFATTLAAAYMLRMLSAPRTHRFLPHFRVRVLTAFLLVVLALSTPAIALLALPPRPGMEWVALAPLFFVSYLLFIVFAPAPGMLGGGLLSAALVLVGRFVEQTAAPFAPVGVGVVVAGVGVWAAWWTGFAVWYLRTPAIGPYRWPPKIMPSRWLEPRTPAETGSVFTRRAAIAATLKATVPASARQRVVHVVVAFAGVAALAPLVRRPGSPYSFGLLLGLALLPIFSAPFASRLARRAKLLWLASGESRRALFAASERELWVSMPGILLTVLCMATLLALAYDVQLDVLGRIMLLWATGMPFGVYIGLAAVRGSLLEYVPAAVLVASVAVGSWSALSQPPRFDWLVAVAVFQLAAAAALRGFAIVRWRRIDWLAFRPLRLPSQGLRGR